MSPLPHPLLITVAGLSGLLLGSVSVWAAPRLVAYRLDDPITFPGALVVVPVAGVLLTRWRWMSSLLVELATAGLCAGLAAHFGWSIRLPIACAYSAVFVLIAYIDIDHRLVLNRVSYPAALLAVPAAAVWPGVGWESSLVGAAVGGLIFVVLQIVGRGALGTGDTKLAIVIGAIEGFPGVFNALLAGMLLGGLAAVVMLVALRRGRKTYIAYAPYLAAGAVLGFFLTG